ncbi:adenine phosphoribosyltransferase [Streptoalloteichus hindustanus]|uniref:Adenine phosphoribosyltransferase n=2 Tax=Streptoalloteichus hindustanus TaxID=2017 RepID=A0A1M5HBB6_STRHI|nr:adenine phosphoribosyltransferase [Streptoalloteichus hindustanus]
MADPGEGLREGMVRLGQALATLGELSGDLERARGLIREVPDFPEPGVLFRDISPVLADAEAFRAVVYGMVRQAPEFDLVLGVEARGFLLGAAVAYACGTGVVGVRKPGKLPAVAHRVDYTLEYGTATLELPEDTVRPGQRVLVVDDVLATGGTVLATCELARRAGAEVVGVAVALELSALGGRERLSDLPLQVVFTA